jgi:hypothetical protein
MATFARFLPFGACLACMAMIAQPGFAQFVAIAKLPDVVTRLKLLGIETIGGSTNEFTTTLASDVVRWGDVARAANIRIEP